MKRPATTEDDDFKPDAALEESGDHEAETRDRAKHWLSMGAPQKLSDDTGEDFDDLDELIADDETSPDNATNQPIHDNVSESFKDVLSTQKPNVQDLKLAIPEKIFQSELVKVVQKHATWPKPGIDLDAALGVQAAVEDLILKTLQTAEALRANEGAIALTPHHVARAKEILAEQGRESARTEARERAAKAADARAAKWQKLDA